MDATIASRSDYRPDIDALRALAVLAVIGYHWNIQTTRGGYVGVDVFFVISGFLITRMIHDEAVAGDFSFARFYARRIRRLLPALYVLLVAVAAFSWFRLLPPDYKALLETILSVVVFASNILFWRQTGYFDRPADENPLLHTWSLSVEEQFYLVFPLLIWGSVTLVWRWDFASSRVLQALLFLALMSFAWNLYQVRVSPSAAFFLAPGRAWEFLLGSLLAVRIVPAPRRGWVRKAAVWLGTLMILIAINAFTRNTAFPGANALLPCLGAALVIWSQTDAKPHWSQNRLANAFVFTGKISYSLYLWHWPIFVCAQAYFDEQAMEQPVVKLALFAASFGIAALSYRFVEQPVRRGAVLHRQNTLFAAAVLASVLIAGFGAVGRLTDGFPARVGPTVAEIARYANYQYRDLYMEGTCFLRPDQEPARYDRGRCYDGSKFTRRVLIWGDSHAAHYVSGLRGAVDDATIGVVQANASQCAALFDVDIPYSPLCRSFNDRIRGLVRQQPPEVIIVSAHWLVHSRQLGTARILADLRRTIAELNSYGSFVVLLGPSMEYKQPLPRLLARYLTGTEAPAVAYLNELIFPLDDRMSQELPDSGRFTYVSILRHVCSGRSCPVYAAEAVPMIWDYSHLTAPGSAFVMAKIPTVAVAAMTAGRSGEPDAARAKLHRASQLPAGLVLPPLPDRAPQERIGQRLVERELRVVGRARMTAGGRLVEIHLVAERPELRRHLAGVAGMHAVVAARGGEQDRRIADIGAHGVIGRDLAQKGPVLRLVGVAVFGDPARAGAELGVAAHVEQRHRAVDRAEQLRIAGEHVADQQPAIAAAPGRRAAPAASRRARSSRSRPRRNRRARAFLPARMPALCQSGPNSPPPRILAIT